MPRVLDTYYGLEGGLSYKKFLKHFQDQAKGTSNIALINDLNSGDAHFRKPFVNNSLILVDLASHENANAKNEKQPAVRVIDPTELARLRAVDRVAAESVTDPSPDSYKAKAVKTKRHSKTSTQRRKSALKRKSVNVRAKTTIKRARDIFED